MSESRELILTAFRSEKQSELRWLKAAIMKAPKPVKDAEGRIIGRITGARIRRHALQLTVVITDETEEIKAMLCPQGFVSIGLKPCPTK